MSKKDLVSMDAAAEALRIDAAEVDELLKTGDLRKVWHRAGNDSEAELKAFVMGSDVTRLQRESSPAYLARLVAGEVDDEDDDDSPRKLAAEVQRF